MNFKTRKATVRTTGDRGDINYVGLEYFLINPNLLLHARYYLITQKDLGTVQKNVYCFPRKVVKFKGILLLFELLPGRSF